MDLLCTHPLACALAAPLLLALYLSPSLVAWHRGVPRRGHLLAFNVLMGWTVLGWTGAWAVALMSPSARVPGLLRAR